MEPVHQERKNNKNVLHVHRAARTRHGSHWLLRSHVDASYYPVFSWNNRGSERLSHLLEDAQRESSRADSRVWACNKGLTPPLPICDRSSPRPAAERLTAPSACRPVPEGPLRKCGTCRLLSSHGMNGVLVGEVSRRTPSLSHLREGQALRGPPRS